MDQPSCPGCQALQRRVAQLQAQVERLTAQLDEERRASKRQATPFAKAPPKPEPKKPGRKPGDDYTPGGSACAQAVLMSVWRTCWQQGRNAIDLLSRLLRGQRVRLAQPP